MANHELRPCLKVVYVTSKSALAERLGSGNNELGVGWVGSGDVKVGV